ncbi:MULTISPECIES: Ig-like domain-containing protein, partial [unclassified Acinetobacter]|uniref:Ig-like domain-containing protein n=1 Tax=unclassified Acinetobacter TaxID=196816 RepID=UPI0015D30432
VLGNDTDAENDTLTVTAASALHGTVTINADGTLSYTPNANYTGADTISYSISDGNGGTSSSVVNVSVTPVNDAPVLSFTDSLTSITENSATAGMVVTDANATDAEGDTLTYSLTNNPDGYYSIDPATGVVSLTQAGADWVNGGGNLPAVSVTVTDGTTPVTGTAAMPVTTLVNDAPVANPDTATVIEDTSATITVLGNDTDAENDTLTVTAASALHGTVTINADGTLSYTPNANYTGADTISYSISDGNGGTSSSVVNVSVTPVNDAPVLSFTDSLTSITENNAMAGMVVTDANATDAEGDTLTYSLTNNPDGYYSIDPATGVVTLTQAGADWVNGGGNLPAVSVTVTDGTTPVTGTAAMPVTTLVNDAPVANPDTATVVEDTAATITVLGNDTDAENDTLTVTAASALHGTVTINADGTLSYTPNANYT